jgi:flagellar secretion chaperone FliS
MSNVTASHAAYRRGTVLAATPGQLVVLLYDGARRFLRQAAIATREGEVERAHNTLRRGERIIRHLDGTLDFEQGELPRRLHAIYLFCLTNLDAARLSRDPAKIEQVSELLGELRDAWSEVAAEVERGSELARASEVGRG